RCTIYPNPTSGVFNVQMSQFENLKMKDIEIYNMYGEKVPAHFQINSFSNSQIDLSSQPAGIYFIELKTSKDNYHGKVVKE
ncbi:MAG: T9SS type A sorting domain-containing protein, partial [Bacteroidetes bacterium]|nr:T9SS type A sorting domain-containing protein [Bacteroidota bacterium]